MTDNKPEPKFSNFTVYALDRDRGLTLTGPPIGGDPFTSAPIHVPFGSSILVTAELASAQADRTGYSWILDTEEEQRARYGKLRFGVGEVPEHIKAELRAHRREVAERQRDELLTSSVAARRANSEAGRLHELDTLLAALDAEEQAS